MFKILLQTCSFQCVILLGQGSLGLYPSFRLSCFVCAEYNAIREQPGDAIYVRALCDYDAEHEGELSFKKDDILFIDNTLYNGMQGDWRAWLVDDEGNKLRSGTIPSKSR